MLVRLSGLVGKTETKQERGRKKETGGTEGENCYSPRSESVGRRGWADMELPTLPVLPCRDRTCLAMRFSLKSLIIVLSLHVWYILGTSHRQIVVALCGRATVLWSVNQIRDPLLCSLDWGTVFLPQPQWRCINLLIHSLKTKMKNVTFQGTRLGPLCVLYIINKAWIINYQHWNTIWLCSCCYISMNAQKGFMRIHFQIKY